MEILDVSLYLQAAPKAVHEWALLIGAVAVAIKEAPRGLKTLYGVWVWSKKNVLLREEYRKLRRLHGKLNAHDEEDTIP